MIETGWYGIPGSASYFTRTHVTDMRKPLCKAAIRRDAEFQMCSNGVHLPSVECERCKAAWLRRASTTNKKIDSLTT